MISITCGRCKKDLQVEDELAGKEVNCPGCQAQVGVPQPESLSDTSEATALGADRKGLETQALPSQQSWEFLAPAEKPDEIGRLGPYRVLKVLGAGGMGVVFRAEDPYLERVVALKAMLPAMASNPSAKERFFREAKAAAALKHPHVVTIFQVGEDRGAPFLTMEFLEGEPLHDRLKRETKLPVPEILRIGREIAEGLATAHEKGLIHRDIKPANIWLEGKKGHVKILDFGLVRAMGDTAHLTLSGAIVGTPAFMAPEQAGGRQVDDRCDLFSLGCVLYCMCTGERPFRGNDAISILSALALEDPPSPESLNTAIPTELSELVMKMLAKKPEDRPKSAKIVAELLQAMEGPTRKTGDETIAETHAGRSVKKRSRLRWLIAGGVLALSVVAAAIILRPTPHGTVVIVSDDPRFELVFLKDAVGKIEGTLARQGPTIKGSGKKRIPIRSGEYSLLVKRGKTSFETNRFFIGTDKIVTLLIESLPGRTQVSVDGWVVGVDESSLPNTGVGKGTK